MKFVNVASAKGLKIGESVYTLNDQGEYGAGKLVARSETDKGVELKFEVPQYTSEDKPPSLTPFIVKNITHVALMRNRKQDDEAIHAADGKDK